MRKIYNIRVGDKRYEVEVESVRSLDSAESSPQLLARDDGNNDNNTELIQAPLQGVILDICVSEGENFKKGDKLFIIEAMKMENEVLAPRDGEVVKISTSKEKTVNSGETLLSFV